MSQIVNDRPPVTYHKKTFFQRLALGFRQNKMVYLMWLPVLAFYLIFHYAPMGGLVIAFQNYKAGMPFFSSATKWVWSIFRSSSPAPMPGAPSATPW